MDRYMKIYGFPENQRMEFHDGIYSITSKFAVESAKKFDGMICDAIAKAAKDAGVTKLAILDAKGIVEAFKRLKEYEDAEAEGRLVVLPCKVGDTVWFAHEQEGITETSVSEVSYFENVDFISASVRTNCGDILSLRNAGKTWFLTREEAAEAWNRRVNELDKR